MKRLIACVIGVVAILLAGTSVQAELKLVANFDNIAAGPDGQACNGVLGGVIDTESNGTGNSHYGTTGGTVGISIQGNSGGSLRAIGIGGINNPIDDGESGVVFFRFAIRQSSGVVRHHIGVFANATDDPITSATAGDPKTCPVGFKMIPNGTTAFDVVTLDGATVLKTNLARGAANWYNCWLVVDNGSDTFTLYLSVAATPGTGTPVTMPTAADLVKADIPFTASTADALNCLVFSDEGGTGQADYIYMDDVWWDGDQGFGVAKRAGSPSPGNGAIEVARDVVLSWKPVPFAVTNNVYFGTSREDVNAAAATSLVSTGSDANTYDPPGVLAYGQTYYWRVDEVNTTDQKVFAGSVWSFTVEAASYAIKNITATASGSAANQGPEKSVDGSGLDASDLHGTTDTTMWLSDGVKPAWIQYDFNDVYKLREMWVWNSNQLIEPSAGMGVKDVVVEYSADGVTWTTLTGVQPFARAPGATGYAHNTTIDFGGVIARYVKLTINSNWGGILPQVGLSEVRFHYKPVLAVNPQPTTGKTGVATDVVLSWRTGHEAASHNVYFGTDANALTLAAAVTESRFTPAAVNLGTTYYWRVDEVNAVETPGLWTGKLWSFSTSEYVVIDDMESYNDSSSPIFGVWVDGYLTPTTNGAQVGLDQPANGTFCERTIVHGGRQSMPLKYSNATTSYSEAERTWDTAQNWAANGANTLSLWFRGNPAGFMEPASDHILMNGVGTDIYNAADQGRFVYKQLTGNGSIIARVDRLDNTNVWAKAGVMIRETLDAGSSWAYSLASTGNGVHFQARLATGVNATSDTTLTNLPPSQTTAPIPMWVKIERAGNAFNAYYSADGITWTPNPWNPQTITMQPNVYIGLAVTSHAAGVIAGAELSSISTTGAVTGPWQSADLGIAQPTGNTLDAFYVTVKDSAGKSITIKHPDAAAVAAGTWQQWSIPLSSLTGVDASRVKAMIIGIGDRTSPKHGSGWIYIDDIRFSRPAQ